MAAFRVCYCSFRLKPGLRAAFLGAMPRGKRLSGACDELAVRLAAAHVPAAKVQKVVGIANDAGDAKDEILQCGRSPTDRI